MTAVSYFLCAAAYGALVGLLLLGRDSRPAAGRLLVVGCGITTVWAFLVGMAALRGDVWYGVAALAEWLRFGGWLAFLVALLRLVGGVDARADRRAKRLGIGTAWLWFIVFAYQLDLLRQGGAVALAHWSFAADGAIALLLAAVLCLLVIENVYRAIPPGERWPIRLVAVPLAASFVFDVLLYGFSLPYRALSADLLAMRGVVNALMVPLLVVGIARSSHWAPKLHVSRDVAFYSTTSLLCGAFLLLLAAGAYYVRTFEAEWAYVILSSLLFTSMAIVVLLFTSASFRASVTRFLSYHFYSYQYDYRREWGRFIERIDTEQREDDLKRRVLCAIADVFESPGGLLFIRQGLLFAPSATWNMPRPAAAEAIDSALIKALEACPVCIDVRPGRQDAALPDLPPWLQALDRRWLVVPLRRRNTLLAFVVLHEPRTPLALTAEDTELLELLARQAASYLAEWLTLQSLLHASRFEEFNRRVTFMVHDLKGVTGQLTLLLSNVDRFRDQPAFIDDMIDTIRHANGKMAQLLAQLQSERSCPPAPAGTIEVNAALERIGRRFAYRTPAPILERCDSASLLIQTEEGRFDAVMANFIGNAIEASGTTGRVTVRTRGTSDSAIIEIEDTGTGMSPEFVDHALFEPFRSTKSGGYGIGAFEGRDFVERAGGRLEVQSAPHRGTLIRVILPRVIAHD